MPSKDEIERSNPKFQKELKEAVEEAFEDSPSTEDAREWLQRAFEGSPPSEKQTMIADSCPNCKAEGVWPGDHGDIKTCPHCKKDYKTIRSGWCFYSIPHPHECGPGEVVKDLCKWCGARLDG